MHRQPHCCQEPRVTTLKEDVSRGVAGFASCSNEAVYEKSCELMDLFRNDK